MDHDLESIIPDPGNLWKPISPLFYYPGNTGGGRAVPLVKFSRLGLFLESVPGKASMVTLELKSKQTLF